MLEAATLEGAVGALVSEPPPEVAVNAKSSIAISLAQLEPVVPTKRNSTSPPI